ncbi:MAG: solute carrier family 26 protein [Flavobacteriaceae bacterium]|nr:solute carrier family 26 protein [Flavobacteriaceae bacterium]
MNIRAFIPILDWLPSYKKSFLRKDLMAGFTIGVMLIPQAMAYASVAGLPPVYGLYAALIPVFIYVLLGTSMQLSVGPVAMVSLLTATALSSFGAVDMDTYINYALLLSFMVGGMQLLLGVFRLGFLVNFLSYPVISGFTSAAATIIGLTQLKHLLGVNVARSSNVTVIVTDLLAKINEINLLSVGIGLFAILLIIILKKINKSIPFLLIAMLFGILIVTFFDLGNSVEITRDIPSSIPHFSLFKFDFEILNQLFPMAVTIALVGYMQSIAVAKSLESQQGDHVVNANQELKALGISNLIGSLFQSYPVSGGIARTAVNNEAGAKTPLASLFSALLILCTLLFLTPLFYNLPKTILAAIILVAIYGLIDVKEALFLYKSNRVDFWLLIATFCATLFFGIEKGIAFGVTLSLIIVIYRSTKPHVAVLARVPGTHFYRNIERFDALVPCKDVLIFRFDAQIYFANISFFKEKLADLVTEKGRDLTLIILHGESINNLDSSAIKMLKEIHKKYTQKGVEIVFTALKGPVRDAMSKGGVFNGVEFENCYMGIRQAMKAHHNKKKPRGSNGKYGKYVTQIND